MNPRLKRIEIYLRRINTYPQDRRTSEVRLYTGKL